MFIVGFDVGFVSFYGLERGEVLRAFFIESPLRLRKSVADKYLACHDIGQLLKQNHLVLLQDEDDPIEEVHGNLNSLFLKELERVVCGLVHKNANISHMGQVVVDFVHDALFLNPLGLAVDDVVVSHSRRNIVWGHQGCSSVWRCQVL